MLCALLHDCIQILILCACNTQIYLLRLCYYCTPSITTNSNNHNILCLTFLYPLLSLETSVALHSQEALWPGSYDLQVEVLDAQGLSCPANEIFKVDVCTCVETEHCSLRAARLGTTSSELSAPAIGLLLMTGCLLLCELNFKTTNTIRHYHCTIEKYITCFK